MATISTKHSLTCIIGELQWTEKMSQWKHVEESKMAFQQEKIENRYFTIKYVICSFDSKCVTLYNNQLYSSKNSIAIIKTKVSKQTRRQVMRLLNFECQSG